jgi:hypothetical protein
VSNLINHALEHIFKMLEGDSTEPHLEHAIWNLGKIRWMARNRPAMVDVPMVRESLGMSPLMEGTEWVPPTSKSSTTDTSDTSSTGGATKE